MPECPKCHQFVRSQAIACPHCRLPLKAHGHPGMKLFQATNDEPLCASCVYHADNSCNFPKRPYAMDCTLYQDVEQPQAVSSQPQASFRLQQWVKRNTPLLLVAGLLMISLGVVLVRR
ncbi:zinc ribbon domain-containing protein [Phormidium sp. CLA17]|uniref:zinc ribbon domain-containing protein n=1 Tax=Leptolyngbya sp. Cla-17 TaxID=2803751 RepID=UPI001492E047|nr:zinc ribbon domain-containing protein [Leptolyngbya sp. Cla-17]MBM0740809.1 zinc ribbon domain-containing protein [Leptolyngbya sp. Cla-17]